MSQKNYFKILQWGIYASFLTFLLFNTNWLFPYTTLKQIYFNILMELLGVFWLVLIVKYPVSRPKKSWLTWSIVAWLAILLVTCFTGVDFNLSFWGDPNRMMGWFHLAHWLIFYLILITVFKSKQDWQRLFNLSLVFASLIVLYSLLKEDVQLTDMRSSVNMGNNISTLGNATYVAGVMLVCFFLTLFQFIRQRLVYQKVIYALIGLLVLVGFFYADVSGSQAGLAVGLIIFGLLYAWLAGSKRTKKITLISVLSFVALIAVLYGLRQAPIFNNRFGKIFRDFSWQNTNLNTRLYAWRAGLNGFAEKPVLGWGYGNFNVVFDKFFVGDYYRYGMGEEYFDRAHNNLIDLASTTGAVGLLIYLAIFVCAAYYLSKGYRHKKFDWLVLATITAIIVAYFIHNLAVFDSWGNYFLFFLVLAWIFSLYQGQEAVQLSGASVKTNNKEITAWLLAGAGAVFLIFNYNLAFAKNFSRTIRLTDLLRTTPSSQDLLAYYQEPFKLNTPMDRSSIETVLDYIANNTEYLDKLTKEEKKQIFDHYIDLSRKAVAYNPDNSLSQARLARTLMTTCLTLENKDYCQQVFEPVAKSMATGGQHISVYLIKSITQVYLNDIDGAIATLKQALQFYDNYTDAQCQLAQIYLVLKTDEVSKNLGRDYLKKCLVGGGGKNFATDPVMGSEVKTIQEEIKTEEASKQLASKESQYTEYLKEGLKYKSEADAGNRDAYYKAIEAFTKAAELSESKVWIPYLNLGNLYKILGDYEQADANYNKALEISGGDGLIYLQKIELYQLYLKKPAKEVNDLYQKALASVPVDNANLMINYAAWLRDNGYVKEAIKAYGSLVKSFPNNQAYKDEIKRLEAQQ